MTMSYEEPNVGWSDKDAGTVVDFTAEPSPHIDESARLRQELNDAYTEMSKLRGNLRAVFDRRVWQRVDKWKRKNKIK
jgi:hypothetical protein